MVIAIIIVIINIIIIQVNRSDIFSLWLYLFFPLSLFYYNSFIIVAAVMDVYKNDYDLVPQLSFENNPINCNLRHKSIFCMVIDIGQTKLFSQETQRFWPPSLILTFMNRNLPQLGAIKGTARLKQHVLNGYIFIWNEDIQNCFSGRCRQKLEVT